MSLTKIRPYAKFVVAAAGALVAAANALANGGDVVAIVVAALTALGVHQVSNS